MKKIILTIGIVFGLFSLNTVKAQVFVKIRPVAPVVLVVKPACPSPQHVWIDGHWKWNKKMSQYVWVEGYWIVAKPGKVWIGGHWIEGPHGHKWVEGYWAKGAGNPNKPHKHKGRR